MSKLKIAGYLRISVDTEQDQDSTSIENQRAIITGFVKDKFNSNPYILYKNGNPIEATWSIISASDVGDTVKFAPELKDNMLYPKTIYVKEDSEKVCICATVDGNVVWS